MKKRFLFVTMVSFAAFVIFISIGFLEAFAAAPATIKIGGAVSTTGGFAGPGAQVKTGYEFAVSDINEAGGVFVKEYGKKIPLELVVLDDESNPTKTVSRLETLYSVHQVVAYLGGFSSVLNSASCAVGEKNKVPWIGVAFSAEAPHKQGFKYLFSPFQKSRDYRSLQVFKDMPKDKRPQRLAIWQIEDDWGREMGEVWKKDADEFGAKIVSYEKYALGAKDFSSLIMKAKAADAEMVLAVPTPPEGMAMMKQIKELDYRPKAVFFVRAPDGSQWGAFPEGNYVLLAPGWHSSMKFPMVDKINAKYQAKFNRPADAMVGPAYACVQIIANSIERAGKLDREAIRDAMEKTNMMTAVGPMSFYANGMPVIKFFPICQWQNGKLESVSPKEHASAPLIYPIPR